MSPFETFIFVFYILLLAMSTLFKDKKENKLDRAIEISEQTIHAEEDFIHKLNMRNGNRTSAEERQELDFLSSNPTIKEISEYAMIQLYALQECRNKFAANVTTCAGLWHTVESGLCNDYLLKKQGQGHASRRGHVTRLDECPFTEISCTPDNYTYRTFDGSCNSRTKPLMGKANRAYQRYLPPLYEDCLQSPRNGTNGLASARRISNVLCQNGPEPRSTMYTYMHMSIGQLLDHDLDRTAVAKFLDPDTDEMVNVQCGSGCSTEGLENIECLPIYLSSSDPLYSDDKPCLVFVRSQEYLLDHCKPAARQQANQITAWIDASFVYGSSTEDADHLRTFTNGLLRSTTHPDTDKGFLDLLPQEHDPACSNVSPDTPCFKTGDSRQNEQIGLIALHTVFMRFHNYIARNLNLTHPNWDDQLLFQESRRLLGAVWQHIVYKEYVPSVIGPHLARHFDVTPRTYGFYTDSDESVNADISNVFAAAAFRFGHSQISDTIRLNDPSLRHHRDVHMTEVYFNPALIYKSGILNDSISGVNAVTLGMTTVSTDHVDTLFTNQVAGSLFTKAPPIGHGTDLSALNIQRARDHGIPGYVAWRKWCNGILEKHDLYEYKMNLGMNFNDLRDLIANDKIEIVKNIYHSVEDIDLFVGGLLEEHLPGALIGPTFACIIALQFSHLKKADRFYYENKDVFTLGQLTNIREQTLSSVLCVTLEDDPSDPDLTLTFQQYSMLHPWAHVDLADVTSHEESLLREVYYESANKRNPCSQHAQIDFSLF